MKKGKIDLGNLKDIITFYTGVKKPETLLRPNIGEDCCIIDLKSLKDEVMLISSDPITFTSKDIGKLAVIVNTNDIYASGGKGYGIILNILLPENKTLEDFRETMNQIHNECIVHNLEILGGHTEVTDVVNDIVISVTIIGTSSKEEIVKTSTSKEGDLIFLTKTLGIEGTTILYNEFREELQDLLNEDEKKEIKKFCMNLSIKKECEILKNFKITSMHDVTEGGLIGALFEMSISSHNGFRIFKDKIDIHSVTKKICDYLNKDIYHLISSGSLIFTCEKDQKDIILEEFRKQNINCSLIGEVIPDGNYFINDGEDIEKHFDISDSFFE